MGIDYGSRSIGVAVSDELGITVRPLTTIRRDRLSQERVIERIRALATEHEIGTLVVGLPLRADGTRGDAAERVEQFIRDLQSHLTIPVASCNEYLSSREADDLLRAGGADQRERRARSDEYAAAIILRDYLDAVAETPKAADDDNSPDH
ncbi:MAG TPA: Holliday junction resolvase RuvX [Blastocatellia bacterium]|nr:Holliday junction resolvase RuvX [Blastocatellia bacterium]